jgi:SMI1 / KNR4 family (SUKH-1)
MKLKYSSEDYAKILIDDWSESIRLELLNYEQSLVADRCPELISFLSPGYQGKSSAGKKCIQESEKRLGIKLPEDYVAFVNLADEWPTPGLVPPGSHLLSINEIGFYRDLYKSSYEIWMSGEGAESYEQIGVYGADQLPEHFCRAHLKDCIAISTQVGSAAYVLNPNVKTSTAWEAWWMDFHHPGVIRFPSFFALIEYQIAQLEADIKSLLGD